MASGEASPNSDSDVSVQDPAQIHTLAELASALKRLRGTRSYAELNRAAGGGRGKTPVLPPSTLSDVLNGKSVPARHTLDALLRACGVNETDQQQWVAAWERVSTADLRRPAGACRVRAADPRRLGVHASIQVIAGADDLPPYVPRDFDAELRTAITAAFRAGGMVLLSGGSSVGKTRTLFETARAVLPDWWLLHPADAAGVRAFAQAPTPRTMVWLDELQRYLDQPGGLPAGLIRDLLAAGVVVLATVWPDEVAVRSAPRVAGEPDQLAEDREVLKLARIIDVPAAFRPAERGRAAQLAGDGRIRIALEHADPGVTQVLAAGPELIRRWQHAPASQCYGQAVITAALDARRVGAQAPLTVDYLTAAAPAYLTPAQQATAAPDWFDKAIRYAVTPVQGAASCLIPVAAGMGQIAGYLTADYLYQSARTIRRTEAVPDPVWQAIVTYHHAQDGPRLADNAERRGKIDHAIAFYREPAPDADGGFAAVRLAGLLARQGQVQEAIAVLRQRADAGDLSAAVRLADLLADQGQVQEAIAVLRQRADAGDGSAAVRLVDLLAEQGRIDALEGEVRAGTYTAAVRLAQIEESAQAQKRRSRPNQTLHSEPTW